MAYPSSGVGVVGRLDHVTGGTQVHRWSAPPCGLASAARRLPIKRALYALCHFYPA